MHQNHVRLQEQISAEVQTCNKGSSGGDAPDAKVRRLEEQPPQPKPSGQERDIGVDLNSSDDELNVNTAQGLASESAAEREASSSKNDKPTTHVVEDQGVWGTNDRFKCGQMPPEPNWCIYCESNDHVGKDCPSTQQWQQEAVLANNISMYKIAEEEGRLKVPKHTKAGTSGSSRSNCLGLRFSRADADANRCPDGCGRPRLLVV